MNSQESNHIRASSLDRARHVPRQRGKTKPEVENALAIYEAKLQELMAAAETMQQQINRWQSGLAEWKTWLSSARLKQANGAAVERSQSHVYTRGSRTQATTAESSSRGATDSGRRSTVPEYIRQYHLSEASKCLTTSAGDIASGTEDENNGPTNTHPTTAGYAKLQRQEPGLAPPKFESPKAKAVSSSQPPRQRPLIPKLGLAQSNVGAGAWLGGETTQGEVYPRATTKPLNAKKKQRDFDSSDDSLSPEPGYSFNS